MKENRKTYASFTNNLQTARAAVPTIGIAALIATAAGGLMNVITATPIASKPVTIPLIRL